MTRDEAERLRHALADWAHAEPTCRALAVVGSWARDAPRDDSDLDLMVLTTTRDRWADDDGWLRDLVARLGFRAAAKAEVYGVTRAWRLWLTPQVELELGIADTSWAETRPVDPGTRRVVRNGMNALVDKDGLLHALHASIHGEG